MLSQKLRRYINTTLLLILVLLLELGLRSLLIFGWNYIVSENLNCLLFSETKLSFTKGILITYLIQFYTFIKANFNNQLNDVITNKKEQ